MTELICSLRTLNQLLASVSAEHFLEAVAGIKRAREAYLAQEIDTAVYVSKLKKTLRGRAFYGWQKDINQNWSN
jgi:hypothetical protein